MLVSIPPPITFQFSGLGVDPEPIGSDRLALLLSRHVEELETGRRPRAVAARPRPHDARRAHDAGLLLTV